MSDAFFCDRCGRAFPWRTKKRIFAKGFDWNCGIGDNNEVKDICDDCLDDLRKFMNVFNVIKEKKND